MAAVAQRGVELIGADGARRTAVAAREVVMAAGAIGTPQILQLSGIGAAPLLQQLGIAVQHELPGVGENLQDHLQIRAVFAVDGVKTLNRMAHSLARQGRDRARIPAGCAAGR